MTDYDDTPDKSPGTTRRAFLGAAAALAGITAGSGTSTATGNHSDVTVEHGDFGTRKASLPRRDGLGAFLELYSVNDDDATFQAKAFHFSDHQEESHVELKIALSGGNLSMSLNPDRARELGNDLLAAADHAEHGGDINGSD